MSGVGSVVCALCVLAAALPWWWTGRVGRVRAVTCAPEPRRESARIGPERLLDDVDVVVLLGLLDAAITSGAGLPGALSAVGRAVGGEDGGVLARAGAALVLGADWETAWAGAPRRLAPLIGCLAATWSAGAAPGPALRTAADRLVQARRTAAREAAAQLGVRLVLPLGVCFLPAFVLVGLVPVMVSIGGVLLR